MDILSIIYPERQEITLNQYSSLDYHSKKGEAQWLK